MPEARAWLVQAGADLNCAERVFDSEDPSTFCQAIAKHKQAVEKSIQGLLIAFREFRGHGFHVGWGHDVSGFVGLMLR